MFALWKMFALKKMFALLRKCFLFGKCLIERERTYLSPDWELEASLSAIIKGIVEVVVVRV